MEPRPAINRLPELISMGEICARLGSSEDFVSDLNLPKYRFSRRAVRYDVKDVEEAISKFRIEGKNN